MRGNSITEMPNFARGAGSDVGDTLRVPRECRNAFDVDRDVSFVLRQFVVFQLGKDQICLLHMPTKRLALIARGRSPLVVEPK